MNKRIAFIQYWNRIYLAAVSGVAVRAFIAIALGTLFAFIISVSAPLLYPLIESNHNLLRAYIRVLFPLRSTEIAMLAVAGTSLLLIACLVLAFDKVLRSVRLGLIKIPSSVFFVGAVVFWVLLELHHVGLGLTTLLTVIALTALVDLLSRFSQSREERDRQRNEADLPLSEDGEDLLGRREIVNILVANILLERPSVIAVTAPYGRGKTSVLNLVLGQLKKAVAQDRPIVVKFNPWLASDSNSLVLSLLNSVVSEMSKSYIVPGLSRDALSYARTLLTAIPKFDRLKDLFSEPSQEDRIASLANRIAETGRRILVVLDDLDRMEAKELETVFKLLRGSDTFLNVTFVCAFEKNALACILKSTRPHQNTNKFIEKFFALTIPLPETDSGQLQAFFSQKIITVLARYGIANEYSEKSVSGLWDTGAGIYFQDLRRIKLFLNKLDHSLERIGSEVNVIDLMALELIRDTAPAIYEEIYNHPEKFYQTDLAFEAKLAFQETLEDANAKERRATYYERVLKDVPERDIVSGLLAYLFPRFAEYRGSVVRRGMDEEQTEEAKRIFHPRYFRQYFLMRVPSELFSQKEFDGFASRIHDASEADVVEAFNKIFRSLENEDFKRWHFVHRLEQAFDPLRLTAARGLCRALAQNSWIWTSDAFEFMIAVRCTRKTLLRMRQDSERESFLELIIKESSSTLFALLLVEILEKEASEALPPELQQVKHALFVKMRQRYLVAEAPSIFEEFKTDASRIEPIQLMLAWRRLGPDAVSDQRQYLLELFERRPANLNPFLKTMFRVDFMDDYAALKPLTEYAKLASLIDRNAEILDGEKVKEFRARYQADKEKTDPV